MKSMRTFTAALASAALCIGVLSAGAWGAPSSDLRAQVYATMLDQLRTELTGKIPPQGASADAVSKYLASDVRDAKLAKFVVMSEATPAGLAEFGAQGNQQVELIRQLLADDKLMLQMVIADGARGGKYGQAMQIYTDIQKASDKSGDGVLQRLAVAIGLEHALPIKQSNPAAATDAPRFIDPVKRYLQYEKAYLGGELDPAFDQLTTWDLRYVVNGDEPDETLVWGRQMLRNYRPDHIYTPNAGWRYVSIVRTDVRYGSGDVKYDRPELQNYQNILMNGGVCGRRAFIGRFILRAFGIPTTARPSRGHAALAHWTPDGWVVNLGGGWGAGWTATPYRSDLDFLATTQARAAGQAFLQVKRAQWTGDVLGEKRTYGEKQGNPAFWNGVSLKTQRAIINASKAKTLAALGTDLGEADKPTVAEEIMATPIAPEDKQVAYLPDGTISIPAAAYSKPSGSTPEVQAMKSFAGGMQVYLPRFGRAGKTILRGGTWKTTPEMMMSGSRLLSDGYGVYPDWGFRVAMTPTGNATPRELTLDLGNGVSMELVYIKPGTFTMGGENKADGRFKCIEVPHHQVTLTKGFYLGKYEVTQAQYQAITGSNPSRSTKAPDCPVDNIGEGDAVAFCASLAKKTGKQTRLPTEAEWEYACRAGSTTKWYFGDDASTMGDYGWFKPNAGGKSHPVGQKKPNAWGLYDMYGNVCERIADTYAKDYYAKSPKQDPTGPSQSVKSQIEYLINVPHAGKYALTAQVVTKNYDQRLFVRANSDGPELTLEAPFTCGQWQECAPITLTLAKGENTLRFLRKNPPQYGMAIKSFTLKPVR